MSNYAVAIVFPGQASQKVGMLRSLALRYSLVQETFAEVSEVLKYDIWTLVQNGPIEELNKTYRSQPIILTASVAIWRVWRNEGGYIPKIMTGHSLGEYSALVCAESIDLSTAVTLVMKRGILMQETVPYGKGAMSLIIGLNDDTVCSLCNKVARQGKIVAPACFNAPKNIVISGHKDAVNRVNYLCKIAGAKRIYILPISVPSHCLLMQPMVEQFKEELRKIIIRTPNIPIVSNADICIIQDPECIRSALVRQLYTPVYWNKIVNYCIYKKIGKFIEMGPGNTLHNLIRNIVSNNICSIAINDPIALLKEIQN